VFSAARASRAVDPPTSSSLADEKRVGSLRLFCSLRSLRLALVSRCLPHSLADEKHVCSLASSRTAARQPGSARRRAIRGLIARCRLRDVRWVAAVFVGSGGTETRCSAISSCTQLAAGAGARCARAPMRDRRREHRGSAHFATLAASQVLAGARPSCLPSSPRPRFMKTSANELRARAAGWSGSASTMGTPASPEARSSGSRGICASRDTG
jgi:hypothetical protein